MSWKFDPADATQPYWHFSQTNNKAICGRGLLGGHTIDYSPKSQPVCPKCLEIMANMLLAANEPPRPSLVARKRLRGHEAELVNGKWAYTDGAMGERACKHCGMAAVQGAPDFCLGSLQGVSDACCGHGDVSKAYIKFRDRNHTTALTGQAVLDLREIWKKAPVTPATVLEVYRLTCNLSETKTLCSLSKLGWGMAKIVAAARAAREEKE